MKIMAIIVSSPFSPFREWWTINLMAPYNVSVGTHGRDFEDAVDVKENSVGDYD